MWTCPSPYVTVCAVTVKQTTHRHVPTAAETVFFSNKLLLKVSDKDFQSQHLHYFQMIFWSIEWWKASILQPGMIICTEVVTWGLQTSCAVTIKNKKRRGSVSKWRISMKEKSLEIPMISWLMWNVTCLLKYNVNCTIDIRPYFFVRTGEYLKLWKQTIMGKSTTYPYKEEMMYV